MTATPRAYVCVLLLATLTLLVGPTADPAGAQGYTGATPIICPNFAIVYAPSACPVVSKTCPDGTVLADSMLECPRSAESKCTEAQAKAQSKFKAALDGISVRLYLDGDAAAAALAVEKATQRFNAAYLKAELKAVAAGGACASDGDVETAIEEIVSTLVTPVALASGQRYRDNGDGTVTDHLTGLQWEKKVGPSDLVADYGNLHDVDNGYSWGPYVAPYAATGTAFTDFLANLNGGAGACFAGQCDWRMPSFKELRTLLLGTFPNCPSSPCIDPVFGVISGTSYWSATTDATNAGKAHAVEFSGGYDLDTTTKEAVYPVRAVRTLP
jgi:hypothetical protein